MLKHPDSDKIMRDVGNLIGDGRRMEEEHRHIEVVNSLKAEYDKLLPRWKGVALTAKAKLQASLQDTNEQQQKVLPSANIKFSTYPNHNKDNQGKSPTLGSSKYSAWESVGITVSEIMSLPDLAQYKYHIDLGGGGGTTWTGTMDKLAMPGLLFHDVTSTKDYFHDRLIPWKHYVPVSEDFLDLNEAKRIADAGTQFMREMGTPEGFGQMLDGDFVELLQRVIEAYVPVSNSHPRQTWRDVLRLMGEDYPVSQMTEFSGHSATHSCQRMDSKQYKYHRKERKIRTCVSF